MRGAKKIPFAEGYSITKTGKVYFNNEKVKTHETGGYKSVYLKTAEPRSYWNSSTKSYRVHRLVAFVWNNRADEIKDKSLQVHHRNNNKHDNRLSNLVICTPSEHQVYHKIQREFMEYAATTKKFKEFEKIRLQNYLARGKM